MGQRSVCAFEAMDVEAMTASTHDVEKTINVAVEGTENKNVSVASSASLVELFTSAFGQEFVKVTTQFLYQKTTEFSPESIETLSEVFGGSEVNLEGCFDERGELRLVHVDDNWSDVDGTATLSELQADARSSPKVRAIDTATMFDVETVDLCGKRYKHRIAETATAEDLKRSLQAKAGIPIDQQRLIYGGKQMEDGRKVRDYGVPDDGVVNVVLRLRGGMYHESSGREDLMRMLNDTRVRVTANIAGTNVRVRVDGGAPIAMAFQEVVRAYLGSFQGDSDAEEGGGLFG